MALVTNITKKVDIPHEEGGWMEFRRLSWRQLENASEITADAMLDRMKKLGGDLLTALRDLDAKQEQAPQAQYDRAAILRAGIAAWSYDAKINPDTVDSLDEETAVWAFSEILSFNKPRTEEERKNA